MTPTPYHFFYDTLGSRYARDEVTNSVLGGFFDASRWLYEDEVDGVNDEWRTELTRICKLYERGY